MRVRYRFERSIAIIMLLSVMAFTAAVADWHPPVRISGNGAYMPRIAYSDGILHSLYYDWDDEVSYVRSTDFGESWSSPLDMIPGWSCYPQIAADGDSIIAIWVGERDSWYHSNYIYRSSTNGGATWDDTSKVFATDRSDIGEYNLCISGRRVFVVCDLESGINFIKSTNLGNTWNQPLLLDSNYNQENFEIASLGDTVLIIMGGRRGNGDSEVYTFRSLDAGQNWTGPSIISAEDNCDSYRPHLAVNQSGNVAVCWGASGGNYSSNILLRLSSDFGQTWDSALVNPNFHGWVDIDIAYSGDTLHLASGGGRYMYYKASTDNGYSWTETEIVDSDRYASYDPEMITSPGKVHVIWDDRRYHTPGIYYSNWDADFVRHDTLNPELLVVGNCSLPVWVNWYPNLSVEGNYTYVAGSKYDREQCVNIVDVSDPGHPEVVGFTDSLYYPLKMAASGSYLYLACGDNLGLVTYDVSDPNNPELCSVIPRRNTLSTLCQKDSLVYYAVWGMLTIYDVSDPFHETLIGYYDSLLSGVGIHDIEVDNGIAYLLGYEKLYLIDVSDPTHPSYLSRYTIQLPPSDDPRIAVAANFAYIVSNTPDVEIVDATNPIHPVHSSTFPLSYGNSYNLKTHGNYLVIAHGDITLADISNPANPVMVAEYADRAYFYDVDIDDEYIYGDADHLLEIFRLPEVAVDNDKPILPAHSLLSQNYPNPFNAQTTIRYSLTESGPVNLTIYNLLGQKVATLIDGVQTAGEHKVIWDAVDLSSGIYFAKIENNSRSSAVQMLLLR